MLGGLGWAPALWTLASPMTMHYSVHETNGSSATMVAVVSAHCPRARPGIGIPCGTLGMAISLEEITGLLSFGESDEVARARKHSKVSRPRRLSGNVFPDCLRHPSL
jgi:hypothetical protein